MLFYFKDFKSIKKGILFYFRKLNKKAVNRKKKNKDKKEKIGFKKKKD